MTTMTRPTADEIFAQKPEARPRIYAYSIADQEHEGLLKVGQTRFALGAPSTDAVVTQPSGTADAGTADAQGRRP